MQTSVSNTNQRKQIVFSPIDVDALLLKHPLERANTRDKLLILIQTIWLKQLYTPIQNNANNYVPINSKTLERKVDDYRPHLKYLKQRGVLLIDETYIPSTESHQPKTKRYRLSDEALCGKVKPYAIKSKPLNKKIKKQRIDQDAVNKYPRLYQWFNDNLTIEHGVAVRHINAELDKDLKKAGTKESMIKSAICRYNCKYISIYRIHNKIWSFKNSGKDNRLHTVLTNMSKSLRPYLRYNGEELLEWDIINSQPLLSTILLSEQTYNNDSQEGFDLESILTHNKDIKWAPNQNDPLMFGDFLSLLQADDVQRYIELCKGGDIYEHLAGLYYPEEEANIARNKAKKMFFQIAYDNPETARNYKTYQLFQEHFPNVIIAFKYIQRSSYKDLALILQNMEATIVLGGICGRIEEQLPDCPIFTIHDSVMCPKSLFDSVSKLAEETLHLYLSL